MLVEPIRIVADWLKRADYGVNAMLPLVKRDAGDPVAPPVALILDETRDAEVQEKLEPKRHPAIYVTQDLPYELEEMLQTFNQPRDGTAVLALRYIVRQQSGPKRVTDAAYTLRAVLASISRLWSTNAGATARQRNDVQLITLLAAAITRVDEDVGQSRSSGAAVLSIRLRESATSV